MAYLTSEQLRDMGVVAGRDARVSVDARLFGGPRIVLGDNVRIDAFCVLSSGGSGSIVIGSHVHIASGARLFGEGAIAMADFSSVSAGSTLYSASDDYSGDHLMGPGIPSPFTSVDARPISLERFAAVGAHCLVLPGVTLGEGAVLGAMSMATRDLEPWKIYAGVPCQQRKERRRGEIELALAFEAEYRSRSECP